MGLEAFPRTVFLNSMQDLELTVVSHQFPVLSEFSEQKSPLLGLSSGICLNCKFQRKSLAE